MPHQDPDEVAVDASELSCGVTGDPVGRFVENDEFVCAEVSEFAGGRVQGGRNGVVSGGNGS